jgi:hypothetical protein
MMSNAQLTRIPSIELQLFRWISLVDAAGVPDCAELKQPAPESGSSTRDSNWPGVAILSRCRP